MILEKRAALGRSIMSQHSAPASSFTATCPGCGLKLRFALGPDMPARLRIQCSSCKMVFAVRRPGADASQLSMTGATPPTLIGMPTIAELGFSLRHRAQPWGLNLVTSQGRATLLN